MLLISIIFRTYFKKMKKCIWMVAAVVACSLLFGCSTIKGVKDKVGEDTSMVDSLKMDTVQVEKATDAQSVTAESAPAKTQVVGYNDEVQGDLNGGTYVRRVLYRESEVNPKPQFVGGDAAYKKYLSRTVKYPQEALKKRIQGSVRVGFTVNSDGSIVNAKVERKVNHLLDAEALRVVKSMPKWNPGKLNGQPVPVKMTVPINFRLQVSKK